MAARGAAHNCAAPRHARGAARATRMLGGGDFTSAGVGERGVGRLRTWSGGSFGEEPAAQRAHRAEGVALRWPATQCSAARLSGDSRAAATCGGGGER
jgi:hypothetical protein